jgi:hypothetical protein
MKRIRLERILEQCLLADHNCTSPAWQQPTFIVDRRIAPHAFRKNSQGIGSSNRCTLQQTRSVS